MNFQIEWCCENPDHLENGGSDQISIQNGN
jgi:hypothetical protein